MGFVLARDFLKALALKLEWKNVREICGKCVLRLEPSTPRLK
jgi:hypothetical protein